MRNLLLLLLLLPPCPGRQMLSPEPCRQSVPLLHLPGQPRLLLRLLRLLRRPSQQAPGSHFGKCWPLFSRLLQATETGAAENAPLQPSQLLLHLLPPLLWIDQRKLASCGWPHCPLR